MPLSSIFGSRQVGAVSWGLLIEGLPIIFTTDAGVAWSTTGLPTGLTQYLGLLKRESFMIGAEVKPKTGDLTQPDNTFHLVDARILGGIRHVLSDLFGSGVERSIRTTLTSSVPLGTGTFTVVDASAFPATSDIHINKEAINADKTAPDTFDMNTRAKYGSIEISHTYDPADAEDEFDTEDLRPIVSSRPLTQYGRFVTLYGAAKKSDGTLEPAEVVWRGRLKGNVRTGPPQWDLPCDSLWNAMNTMILSRQRSTVWENLVIPPTTIAARRPSGDFTPFTFPATTTTYASYGAFIAAFVAALNAQEDADGFETGATTASDIGSGVWRLAHTASALYVDVGGLSALFGVEAGVELRIGYADPGIGSPGYTDIQEPTGPVSARDTDGVFKIGLLAPGNLTYWTPVEGDVDGSSYSIRSIVVIDLVDGPMPFELLSVDVGGGFITVRQLFGYPETSVISGATGGPDTRIRQGVLLQGDFVECWKAFIEATSTIPYEIRPHIRSEFFDWTGLRDARPGGLICQRYRVITEQASCRALLEEDLAFCGMQPSIKAGKITAFSLSAPLIIDDALDINHETLLHSEITASEKSQQEVKNQLKVEFEFYRYGQVLRYPFTFNEPTSQSLHDTTGTRTIKMTGLQYGNIATIAAELAYIASTYFAIYSRDYPVLSPTCTMKAVLRAPGEGARITDFAPIDPSTGKRGVTDRVVLLTKVLFDPHTAKVDVQCIDIQDAVKRSGFAPVAKVTAYTLVGGVTHRLTLASGIYATDQAEGLYFGVSWKVLLKEIDDSSPLADEAFTIQAVAADGLTVDIDAAPGASMQTAITAGTVILTEDEYDTASQQLAAKQYLYVADDADNKLGTSGDDGYQMS